MKRFRFQHLILVLIVASVVAPLIRLYAATHSRQRYQGRPLELWLRDLGHPEGTVRAQAELAVRHFGSAATTKIVQLLRARQKLPPLDVLDGLKRWAWLRAFLLSDDELQDCGIRACAVLGAAATPALPELMQVMRERPSRHVADAISAIGPAALPTLNDELLAANDEVRAWTAYAVGRTYALAGRSHRLFQRGQDSNEPDWLAAAVPPCLSNPATLTSPIRALLECAEHADPSVRASSIWALAQIGQSACAAPLKLLPSLSAADRLVRGTTEQVLRRLEPVAQSRAPVAAPRDQLILLGSALAP